MHFNSGFPVSFVVGSLTIHLHVVLEFLAFAIGFRYYIVLRRQTDDPITAMNRIWILVGATTGALIFSRLTGALER